MARRTVIAESRRFQIADDDPAPPDLLHWAILRCRLFDELTLEEPRAPLRITTRSADLIPRVGAGGLCGLVGRPRQASSALLRPGALDAVVHAPGYLPCDLTAAIDAARRTLTGPAAAGTTSLSVTPPDPAPRKQFRPGRGAMLERASVTEPDQFSMVDTLDPPPPPNVVPLNDGVDPARGTGARVAGVPIVLPDQPLHRSGVLELRGRIQRRVGATTLVPATGATITLMGVWWDYPATLTTPPRAPELCVVDPPLRFAYDPGSPVHSCTLASVGPPAALRELVSAGAASLLVAPNAGLNPAGGDLLRLGDPIEGGDEVVLTDGFDATADPTAAVRIRLRTRTGSLHRAGEPVQPVQANAVAAVAATAREAQEGDRVLFSPGLGALPTTGPLIVGFGTPGESYHRATQLPVVPAHLIPVDATGRFSWPPVSRLAQIRIRVRLPPSPDVQLDVALDYASDPNVSVILT